LVNACLVADLERLRRIGREGDLLLGDASGSRESLDVISETRGI